MAQHPKLEADAGFRLPPLGRRVRDFLWEVMLQGKVIRQRPLPGLAHALVFWGFCAFALVTVNHFAAAFIQAGPLQVPSGLVDCCRCVWAVIGSSHRS